MLNDVCGWLLKHGLENAEIRALIREIVKEGDSPRPPVNVSDFTVLIGGTAASQDVDGGEIK